MFRFGHLWHEIMKSNSWILLYCAAFRQRLHRFVCRRSLVTVSRLDASTVLAVLCLRTDDDGTIPPSGRDATSGGYYLRPWGGRGVQLCARGKQARHSGSDYQMAPIRNFTTRSARVTSRAGWRCERSRPKDVLRQQWCESERSCRGCLVSGEKTSHIRS